MNYIKIYIFLLLIVHHFYINLLILSIKFTFFYLKKNKKKKERSFFSIEEFSAIFNKLLLNYKKRERAKERIEMKWMKILICFKKRKIEF
jgi:hypothetical protein